MAELERLKINLERGKMVDREFLSRVSAMGLAATCTLYQHGNGGQSAARPAGR